MPAAQVRDATPDDLGAILGIFNDVIATSTAVYSLQPTTLEERRAWFDARRAAGFPVLVAQEGGAVCGFASFGDFRGTWPGYRYSVEHSVHVRADSRGRGVGRLLLQSLFAPALAMGKHVMVGGIDADNAASLRLHEALGFERVAHFREVGRKFGRWLDLVFVQRCFDSAAAPRDD